MKKGEILDKVYKSNLTSRAKQIMFYLINRANAEGTCFPSVRTIGSDCGVSERTVQRTMKILLKEGFVNKENRYRGNGGQSSNLYKLKLEPENIIKIYKCNEEKGNGEYSGLAEEKNNSLDEMENINFGDYIEATVVNESNLKSRKQTAIGVLVNKYLYLVDTKTLQKCHPIYFKNICRKLNGYEKAISLNFQCHGVSDKLHPP